MGNKKPEVTRNREDCVKRGRTGRWWKNCSLNYSETQRACSNVEVQLRPRGGSAVLDQAQKRLRLTNDTSDKPREIRRRGDWRNPCATNTKQDGVLYIHGYALSRVSFPVTTRRGWG